MGSEKRRGSAVVQVRCTPQQKSRYVKAAGKEGRSLAGWFKWLGDLAASSVDVRQAASKLAGGELSPLVGVTPAPAPRRPSRRGRAASGRETAK